MRGPKKSKLIIGTANFGAEYGIKNHSGRLSDDKLVDIIATADLYGISTFDTANSYGDSEEGWEILNSAPRIS